jgi:hypothetical protein
MERGHVPDKNKPIPLVIAAGIMLVIVLGCSDDGTGPSKGAFSFKVTVVDGNGDPMPGIRISRQCHLEGVIPVSAGEIRDDASLDHVETIQPPSQFSSGPPRPNPASGGVALPFGLPVQCMVELRILDWLDKEVFSPFSLPAGPGSLTLAWPLVDSLDARVPDGVYHVTIEARDQSTDEKLYSDAVYFTSYNSDDPYRTGIGHTSWSGRFSTYDKGYFPSAQGHDAQMGYTVMGEPTNEFSFSDSVTVGMHTELPPQTSGWVYWMKRGVRLAEGGNSFEFVFEPDDSIYVGAGLYAR